MLTVRNSHIDVNAKNGCVVYFGGIVLEDCAIAQPKGRCSMKGVCRWLLTVRLWLADCNDLKINVIGENSVSVALACVWAEKATTISGGGKLYLKSNMQDCIHLQRAPVTIDNCSIYAEGNYGIMGVANESRQVVTVRNAHVEAYGKSGSVCQISGLVLEGCYVSAPKGAAFDSAMRALVFEGKPVEKLVIRPDADGIHDITADIPESRRGTFNMQGVKLDVDWDSLPAGIYIVDGVKKVKF